MSTERSPVEDNGGKVLIMGDFLHQHLIKEQGDSLRNPNAARNTYTDFEILSGSFLFEMLTQWCFEYRRLRDEVEASDKTIDLASDARQVVRRYGENRVHGPTRSLHKAMAEAKAKAIEAKETDVAAEEAASKAASDFRDYFYGKAKKEHLTIVRSGPHDGVQGIEAFRIDRTLGREPSKGDPRARDFTDEPQPQVALLTSDYTSFFEREWAGYFEPVNKAPLGFDVVMRLTVGPDVDPSGVTFRTINENLRAFLGANRDAQSAASAVAVISSESLRACGHDISFRKAWERTIADTVNALRAVKKGGAEPSALAAFDWVIVTFYNDAALAIPLEDLPDLTAALANCLFVADPTAIERDLALGFDHHTKGTETLVTQALTMAFAGALKPIEDKIEGGTEIEKRLGLAMIHGLKASRFLQCHGYIEVRVGGSWKRAGSSALPNEPDEVENAEIELLDPIVAALLKKERAIDDVRLYVWNRSLSAVYFERQKDLVRSPIQEGRLATTWPFGDVVEVLMEGLPLYGSFPPIAVGYGQGRDQIQRSTRRTSEAYRAAGWLERTEIPLRTFDSDFHEDAPIGQKPTTDYRLKQAFHDTPWWSFENQFIVRIRKAIFGPESGSEEEEWGKWKFARHLFGVAIVRFGEDKVNRRGVAVEDSFDLELLAILVSNSAQAFPDGEGDLRATFENLNFDVVFKGFFGGAGAEIRNAAQVAANAMKGQNPPNPGSSRKGDAELVTLGKALEKGPSERPSPTQMLACLQEIVRVRTFAERLMASRPSIGGILPYLKIGKLVATSRRETQAFRDVKERIASDRGEANPRRPLNLAVFGPPGSGKSFGVKQIMKETVGEKWVSFHEFNLAGVASPEALAGFFLRLQEAHLQRLFPVAFWDEYDTKLNGVALGWLPHFLGPMQDGQFAFEGQLRKLPPCCFVFAGSMFSSFGEMLLLDAVSRGRLAETVEPISEPSPDAQRWQVLQKEASKRPLPKFRVKAWQGAKGTDFKSRLAGVLDVRGIESADERTSLGNDVSIETASVESFCSPFIRKARAIRFQLEEQYGEFKLKSNELLIRDNTLCALLSEPHYAHGLRSIENVVAMFVDGGRDIIDSSVVPTGDQRRIHMSVNAFDTQGSLKEEGHDQGA